MAAASSTTFRPKCGICLETGEAPDNRMSVVFPTHQSGQAHERCFAKIETVWSSLNDKLSALFGETADLNPKLRDVMRFLDKTEFAPRGKSLLQMVEDATMGEVGVQKMVEATLVHFTKGASKK